MPNNNVQVSICYSAPIGAILKLKRQTRSKKLYVSIALVFLLVGASWQRIVDAPIEQTSWSLPKYVPCTVISSVIEFTT